MKHPIGYAQNGSFVYVDLIQSAAAVHIARQPQLLSLVQEMLRKTRLREAQIMLEYDMERTVGYDFVVGTTDTDTIFYAKPLRDDVYARYVKNGKPTPSQHLALVLQRDDQGDYELVDTWVGHISPPRPGSPNETAESKSYWSTHAFVPDSQLIQLRTHTKECPY